MNDRTMVRTSSPEQLKQYMKMFPGHHFEERGIRCCAPWPNWARKAVGSMGDETRQCGFVYPWCARSNDYFRQQFAQVHHRRSIRCAKPSSCRWKHCIGASAMSFEETADTQPGVLISTGDLPAKWRTLMNLERPGFCSPAVSTECPRLTALA